MRTNQEFDQPRLFDIEPLTVDAGTVYALLMPSHAIKFGWTSRAPEVRARELGGQLLATFPGTRDDERTIHVRLAPYRIGRTEDFWPGPDIWRQVELMVELLRRAA